LNEAFAKTARDLVPWAAGVINDAAPVEGPAQRT
jgi:hypothetical protein